jgi:hypothetical protein
MRRQLPVTHLLECKAISFYSSLSGFLLPVVGLVADVEVVVGWDPLRNFLRWTNMWLYINGEPTEISESFRSIRLLDVQ